jgi:hypothetical protein
MGYIASTTAQDAYSGCSCLVNSAQWFFLIVSVVLRHALQFQEANTRTCLYRCHHTCVSVRLFSQFPFQIEEHASTSRFRTPSTFVLASSFLVFSLDFTACNSNGKTAVLVNLHLATLFCSSEKKNSFRSFPNNSR